MPLYILLIPYALFLLIFLVFSLVDLLNVWRFRSGFLSASFLVLMFLAGTAGIFFITYSLLSPVDWFQLVGAGLKFTPLTL
jgi:hypothetical protein